jgi:hypothetical protein
MGDFHAALRHDSAICQILPFISWRRFSARRIRFCQGRIFDAPPEAVAQRAILDQSDPLAMLAAKR